MSVEIAFDTLIDYLNSAVVQLEASECRPEHNLFKLEDFWTYFNFCAQSLVVEVTKLCVIFSNPPHPRIQDINGILKQVETLYINMLKNFYNYPEKQGKLLRKKIQTSLLNFMVLLRDVLHSFKAKGIQGQEEQTKLVGCLDGAYNAIKQLPRSNLSAVLEELNQEQILVCDALQEIEDDVKTESTDDENDKGAVSAMANASCVALIRAALSCLQRTKRCLQLSATTRVTPSATLDALALAATRLSPSVDDVVIARSPPVDVEQLRTAVMELVASTKSMLSIVRENNLVQEEGKSWVNFLSEAVDHNHKKIYDNLNGFL